MSDHDQNRKQPQLTSATPILDLGLWAVGSSGELSERSEAGYIRRRQYADGSSLEAPFRNLRSTRERNRFDGGEKKCGREEENGRG